MGSITIEWWTIVIITIPYNQYKEVIELYAIDIDDSTNGNENGNDNDCREIKTII